MLILMLFVIPLILFVLSLFLALTFSYSGALLASAINTAYFCVFLAVMSRVGHPNSAQMRIRWRREFKSIVLCLIVSVVALSLVSLLKELL